jgi:hypothetical protein
MSVLIGTLAVALFNASKDSIARYMAYLYAFISVGILVRVLSNDPAHGKERTKVFYHYLLVSSAPLPVFIFYSCMRMPCIRFVSP